MHLLFVSQPHAFSYVAGPRERDVAAEAHRANLALGGVDAPRRSQGPTPEILRGA